MPRVSSFRFGATTAGVRSIEPASAPTLLTASVSGHRLTLSWVASADAREVSFVLEAGSARGKTDVANADIGSAASSLMAVDVPGGSYFLRIRARTTGGTSPPSNEIFVRVVTDNCSVPPGPPTALTSAATGTTVTLTWQAPAGGCAPAAYAIEAGSAPGSSNLASFSTASTATSFTASGVANGTYYVRVRSTNANGASGPSSEAQVVVGPVPCAGSLPPARISYTTSGTSVTLFWDAPSGAVLSYIVEAGTARGSTDVAVFDTGSAATSLTSTAATGIYYVRLRTRTSCGNSAPSAEIIVLVGNEETGDNVSILIGDIGGERLVRMTDMFGSNWESGPVGSDRYIAAPWHIAVDARGRIYVADKDTNRIVRMDDLAGNGFKTFNGVGSQRFGDGRLNGALAAVNVDATGRIYIGAGSTLVRVDDMDGNGWTTFGFTNDPNTPGSFVSLKNISFDRQGRIYVADEVRHRIDRFDDMAGTNWITFGTEGSGVGQFRLPEGLAFDAAGRLYISDKEPNHRIVRINDMSGAGWATFGSHGSGTGQLGGPHDLAVSDSGKIYIADTNNARIVRINDMTGAGWLTFGTRTMQLPGVGPCPGPAGCRPPGTFEFIAPKGIRVIRR